MNRSGSADGPPRRRGPNRSGPALTLQIATRSRCLPTASQLRRWARAALARSAQVTVRIVGVREGESLNREFRRRPYATNVLTFCYGRHSPRDPLAGDIVLCAPVIAREAREQHKDLDAHYAHLTVHGLLHLQGYEHERTREARAMEAREVAILRRLGYANPYVTES